MYLGLISLFFPEACRPIVDDGSVRPPQAYETLWQILKDSRQRNSTDSQIQLLPLTASKTTFNAKHLLTLLALLWDKELALLLVYGGLIYSGINSILAALPTQFTETYGFNSLEIDLMFLLMAAGLIVGVAVAGKAIN